MARFPVKVSRGEKPIHFFIAWIGFLNGINQVFGPICEILMALGPCGSIAARHFSIQA
jgi:hypothetical protein